MINRLLFLILLCSLSILHTEAQPYIAGNFIPPLDGVLQVSGSFAELRGNHFHSGVDFRTGGKEGLPVKAIADGYVVRIKISAVGFGKAIYINHPNGYTSVYAHMQSFDSRINDWIRARQYEKESFEVDLFPPKNLLRVTKGEIIGKSGNSGSSEGPHLHFEIRETDTEYPVDPLLFDFPVKDWIRPTMLGLRVYPEKQGSLINNETTPVSFELAGWGPVYRLKINDTINVAGHFSLGISAMDLLNETSNKNGINTFEVYIDSALTFQWKATKFSFSETRYINSFIDYSHYYQTNRRYMRTHIDPGNRLSMYTNKASNGIFKAEPGSLHYVKLVLKDSKQNESILRFIVKGRPVEAKTEADQLRADISGNDASGSTIASAIKPAGTANGSKDKTSGLIFRYNTTNTFSTSSISLVMPGTCLYDTITFRYSESPGAAGMYSSIHQIHTPEVPLHDYYDLSIKLDKSFKGDTRKLVMVKLNSQNKPSSVGGRFDNGNIKARVRDFGRYTVMVDTTKPQIKPLNLKDGLNIAKLQEWRVNISDNLSGIKSYRATLNGAWILMEYDAKNRLLTYRPDALLLPGDNKLIITVEDGVGNTTVKQMTLKNQTIRN